MSTTTSDSSPSAARGGSYGSKSACLFDPRDGSISGVSVFVALGSSGAVSAARFDPLTGAAGNTPLCLIRSNSLARFACPDAGVTDSPGGIGEAMWLSPVLRLSVVLSVGALVALEGVHLQLHLLAAWAQWAEQSPVASSQRSVQFWPCHYRQT